MASSARQSWSFGQVPGPVHLARGQMGRRTSLFTRDQERVRARVQPRARHALDNRTSLPRLDFRSVPLLLLRTRFGRIGGSRNPESGANGLRRVSSLASASPASSKPKAHLFSFLLLLHLQLHSLQQSLLSCVRSPHPVIEGAEVREKRQRTDWFAFGRLFCVVALPVRPSFPFAPIVASSAPATITSSLTVNRQ